jgi:hypothetical protein
MMFEKIIKERLDRKDAKMELRKMAEEHDERVSRLRKLKDIELGKMKKEK